MRKKQPIKILVQVSLLLILVALLMLGGCTARPTPSPAASSTPAGTPEPTGTIRVALSGWPGGTIDPMIMQIGGLPIVEELFDPLIGVDPLTGNISRDYSLAHDWEVSKDGIAWTFHLRGGVKFHDGTELTAEDVKFSIKRNIGPEGTAAGAGDLRAVISDVEVVDRYTVRLRLLKPYPFLADSLVVGFSAAGLIYPQAYVEKIGSANFNLNPMGSGPYRLVTAKPGMRLELTAVDWPHWRVGLPKYKNLIYEAIGEEGTRVAKLLAKEVDVIELPLPMLDMAKQAGFKIVVRPFERQMQSRLFEMWVPGNPGHDPKIRKALNLAIDREAIIKNVYHGLGKPAAHFYGYRLALSQLGYDPTPELYPYDPKRAEQLLREAGYKKGDIKITLNVTERSGVGGSDLALFLRQYWQAIGVDVTIQLSDYSSFRGRWQSQALKGGADVIAAAAGSWSRVPPILYSVMDPKGSIAIGKDEGLSPIMKAALEAKDVEAAKEYTREIIRYVRENDLAIAIADVDQPYAVSPGVPEWDMGVYPYSLNMDALVRRR